MKLEIIQLVAGIIGVAADSLNEQSGPANQPTWDSLAHITITAAVEECYKVSLTMPEILTVQNIGDLETLVRRKLG